MDKYGISIISNAYNKVKYYSNHKNITFDFFFFFLNLFSFLFPKMRRFATNGTKKKKLTKCR